MRAILLYFCIGLFTVGACNNNNDNCNHNHSSSFHLCRGTEFDIDKPLSYYWNCFKEDAIKNDFNYDHVYCLTEMTIGHSHDWQGITDLHKNDITINRHLQKDSIGMKFVLYHEIGHWFGLEHSTGIMKPSYDTAEDKQWVEENWTQLLQQHFDRLKKITPNV